MSHRSGRRRLRHADKHIDPLTDSHNNAHNYVYRYTYHIVSPKPRTCPNYCTCSKPDVSDSSNDTNLRTDRQRWSHCDSYSLNTAGCGGVGIHSEKKALSIEEGLANCLPRARARQHKQVDSSYLAYVVGHFSPMLRNNQFCEGVKEGVSWQHCARALSSRSQLSRSVLLTRPTNSSW